MIVTNGFLSDITNVAFNMLTNQYLYSNIILIAGVLFVLDLSF